MLTLLICGQAIISRTNLNRYELERIWAIVMVQPDRDLAFVRNYHGKIGFLARRERPVESWQLDDIDQWFGDHPDGWAIIWFKNNQPEIEHYKKIVSYPYRGKNIGIFAK